MNLDIYERIEIGIIYYGFGIKKINSLSIFFFFVVH